MVVVPKRDEVPFVEKEIDAVKIWFNGFIIFNNCTYQMYYN